MYIDICREKSYIVDRKFIDRRDCHDPNLFWRIRKLFWEISVRVPFLMQHLASVNEQDVCAIAVALVPAVLFLSLNGR